jgi:hypothetical protein
MGYSVDNRALDVWLIKLAALNILVYSELVKLARKTASQRAQGP